MVLRILLTILIYLCGTIHSWTWPETVAVQQPHHYDIHLTADMSHVSLEKNYDHLLKLSNMVRGMKAGKVFRPVSNESEYQELGKLWRFFFMRQTSELNHTLEAILHRFNYLRTAPPLRLRNNFLSKLKDFECNEGVGVGKDLLENLSSLTAFLGSNWRFPPTPSLTSSFQGEATSVFHSIIANRTLSARQIEDIKFTQQKIAFRKELTRNYKQRSDSLRIAMDLQTIFAKILHNIDSVVEIYRSCQNGPETLLALTFQKCTTLLGSLNQYSYTVQDFSCQPSRTRIDIKARIHRRFRVFDPSTADIVMTASIGWTVFHAMLFYSWICFLACRRMKRKYLDQDYSQVPPSTPSQKSPIGSEVRSLAMQAIQQAKNNSQ